MIIQKEAFKKHWPFLCILLVAIFLRLFKIQDFQFDSDELSAIFRAQNAFNWNEHIQHGVMIDGHPAGLQTFIWIWIQKLSLPLFPLKLLAVFVGILNIILIYAISRKLFSENSALFATICASALWWQIDLSLWVRPYIFGQFFTLTTLYFVHLGDESKTQYHWSFLSFSLAGTFYLHHFAFLSASLLISSSFVIQPLKRNSILKSMMLFFVLSIPQFQIILNQLKTGGLDWLGKPHLSFIWNHIYTIFNDSTLTCLTILIGCIIGFIYSKRVKNYSDYNISATLVLIWITPIIVGYVYSIFVKPVLQNNVLFFSFPFLIIGISRFFSDIQTAISRVYFILLISLLTVQIWTNKKRFDVEIHDVYQTQIQFLNSNKQDEFIIDGPSDVFAFHQNNLHSSDVNLNASTIWDLSKNPFEPSNLITKMMSLKRKSHFNLLTNSGTNPIIRPIVHYYFKNAVVQNFIGGQIDEFNIPDNYDNSIFKSGNALPSPYLKRMSTVELDSTSTVFFKIGEEIKENDLIFFTIRKPLKFNNLNLVTAMIHPESKWSFFKSEQEQIDWRSSNCDQFWSSGFNKAFHVLKLSDIPKWKNNTQVRIGVEGNVQKGDKFLIEIYRFSGNPYQYGIH